MDTKLLSFVAESPRMVKKQDKKRWLSLFSKEARIEDPVGSTPYNYKELPQFWDAFIARNDIVFEEKMSITNGNEVARDVLIHTRLGGCDLKISVPAHLFYEINENNEKLSIVSMQAHWDLSQMVWQFLKQKGSLFAMSQLSFRILKHLGIRGIWGFTKAIFWGIKGKGRKILDQIVASPTVAISNYFIKNPDVNFQFNDIPKLKILNSRSTGYFTTFSFEWEKRKGIGKLKFCPFSKKISSAKFYLC